MLEKGEELELIARKRGAMDVWLGWIATFLNGDNSFKLRTEIRATVRLFFFTGIGCKTWNVQDNMQYLPGKSTGYFRMDWRRVKFMYMETFITMSTTNIKRKKFSQELLR